MSIFITAGTHLVLHPAKPEDAAHLHISIQEDLTKSSWTNLLPLPIQKLLHH